MDRRTFISGVVGGVLAAPVASRAQKSVRPVVGVLLVGSVAQWSTYLTQFREGLKEVGYVDGSNVVIEIVEAEGRYDRLPALAADLARRPVAVILATGVSVHEAKAATSTIPIVFTGGGDYGQVVDLVGSFAHPAGNVTGVRVSTYGLNAKRVELLHDLVSSVTEIALILNPNGPTAKISLQQVQQAARLLGLQLHILNAETAEEIDAAFASIVQLKANAVVVGNDPFFNARRDQFVALAAKNKVPAIYEDRVYVDAGGLLSYGGSLSDAYRQAGIYTGKILHGVKPADLPVLQPMKFELVINLKTAKALGIKISESLLSRADELIQ